MYYKNISVFESSKIILSHSKFMYNSASSHIMNPGPGYQIRYFIKAGFHFTNEDKRFFVPDNSIVITHPVDKYAYDYSGECFVDRFHIRFSSDIFDTDIVRVLPSDLCVLPIGRESFLASLFDKIDFYCKEVPVDFLESMLVHTTEEIVCNIGIVAKKQHNKIPHTENPLFSQIIKFVEANIHSQITLDMICNEFYISKSYLHHVFENQLDISPKKYILFKKLSLAKQDIKKGKTPTSIYSDYGFANYSGFYRAYKKLFGYPPSDVL